MHHLTEYCIVSLSATLPYWILHCLTEYSTDLQAVHYSTAWITEGLYIFCLRIEPYTLIEYYSDFGVLQWPFEYCTAFLSTTLTYWLTLHSNAPLEFCTAFWALYWLIVYVLLNWILYLHHFSSLTFCLLVKESREENRRGSKVCVALSFHASYFLMTSLQVNFRMF